MKIIVGLGNPGFIYARNRHNIGFMCVSHLAREHNIHFDKKQGYARTGMGFIDGQRVLLVRPQTFMNSSGASVASLIKRFNITPAALFVIHDDIDLPLGKIRLRLGGSAGGHKGIDSIINHLHSEDFYRVKVGIGRPSLDESANAEKEAAVIAYVLSDFSPEEKEVIAGVIPKVSQALLSLLTEGLTIAMNKFN